MSKILIVTSRNVVNDEGQTSGVGAATLIFRRAEAIYKEYGLETHIYSLNNNPKNHETGYFGVKFLKQEKDEKEDLKKFVSNNETSAIIFSGDKSYLKLKFFENIEKTSGIRFNKYIDLHGALEEGVEYKIGRDLKKAKLLYHIRKFIFKYTIKKVDGLFVVSDEMKNHYQELMSNNPKYFMNTIKIRCGVTELIDNKTKLAWRKEIRSRLGMNDDTLAFVYSGYRANWQCIDEIIEKFEMINRRYNNCFFVFLTQPDNDFLKTLEKKFPQKNYYVGLVDKEDLNSYLVACDIGMLIRKSDYTNKVAFPNKFSDYVNAGLLLAISDSLKEPVELLKEYKVPHIILNVKDEFNIEDNAILKRKEDLINFYNLTNSFSENELLYSTQVINQKKAQFKEC